MAEQIRVEAPAAEEQVEALRHVALSMAGYAFALAEKAGLSPEEAARLWLERHSSMEPARLAATPEQVAQTARNDARTLSVIHGSGQLDHEGDAWRVTVDLGEGRDMLERFGAPLEFWLRWLAEQGRLLAARDGYRAATWLEGEMLHIEMSPVTSGASARFLE